MPAIDWSGLRSDVKFRKLDLQSQTQVRNRLLAQSLSTDQKFMQLRPEQQQQVFQQLARDVNKQTPALEGFAFELTNEDRIAMAQGISLGPDAAYKNALLIGEALDRGVPGAVQSASDWIVGNRALTESLLAKLALGAKDAIEVLVGTDDSLFDDLRFKTHDYQKLTSWLLQKLPAQQAAKVEAASATAGLAVGMGETVALTMLTVGTATAPGLFTKGLWATNKARLAAAATPGAVSWFATGAPALIEGVGSGVVDLTRDFPRLLEEGRVHGPKQFFTGAAATFGTGVAYDVAFSGARALFHYVVRPFYRAVRGFDLTDPNTIKPYLDAAGNLDPEKFSKYCSDFFSGTISKELLDASTPEDQLKLIQRAEKFKVMTSVPNFDLRSPQGFEMLAAAMQIDAVVDPATNAVKLFDLDGNLLASLKNRAEGVSWVLAHGADLQAPTLADEFAALAGGQTARLRVRVPTKLKLADLTDRQLLSMMEPNAAGTVDKTNLIATTRELLGRNHYRASEKFAVSFKPVAEADFLQSMKFDPGKGGWPKVQNGIIQVPDKMTSKQTVELYLHQVDDVIQRTNKKAPSLRSLLYEKTTLSPEALNAAAQRLPSGSFERVGDRWKLQYTNPATGQKVVQDYFELETANRDIFRMMLADGTMTPAELAVRVYRDTGFSISPSADPLTGIKNYVLRDRNGKVIRSDPDIATLALMVPDFQPRLPNFMMPDLLVRGRTVSVTRTVATGPVASLRRLMNEYGGPERFSKRGGKIVREVGRSLEVEQKVINGVLTTVPVESGTIKTVGKSGGKYFLEVPSLGFAQEFPTMAAADQFLGDLATNYDTIERMAFQKGFRISNLPNGQLVFYDGTGTGLVTKSIAEARAFLASSPDPEFAKELFPLLSDSVDDALRANTIKKLQEGATSVADDAGQVLKKVSKLQLMTNNFISPALSAIEEWSDKLGMPELAAWSRKTVQLRRMISAESLPALTAITKIFTHNGKLIRKGDAKLLGKLLQYKPEMWSSMAKTLMNQQDYVLRPEHINMLRNARTWLDHWGKSFDIDILKFLNDYVPHARDVTAATGGLAEVLAIKERNAILEKLYGPGWKNVREINFLCKNARLDDFLNMQNETNILTMLTWYTEHGLKEKYLGRHLSEMREALIAVANNPQVPKSAHAKLVEYFNSVAGGDMDISGVMMTDTSLELSQRYAAGLKKLAGVFGKDTRIADKLLELANEAGTRNVLELASRNVSYATMGWRPFRIIANTAQYSNTVAIYGHWASQATTDVDFEYMKKLFKRGLLNERIMAATGEDAQTAWRNFIDKSLAGQQNTEYLTRAWTARAAELAFNSAHEKFAKGIVDWDGFAKLANLDIFADVTQAEIKRLMSIGSIESARDLMQQDAIRILMGDYSKENYPHLFTGALGRLFGKFGVYPVAQVDLYRRILGKGDFKTRLVRGLRLTAMSLALYEAFRQVGVDYSGFLLTDPFRFGGGPTWTSLIDMTQMLGGGPEGSLARQNLSRDYLPVTYSKAKGLRPNIPRLTVPGALEMHSLGKAAATASDGNWYGAFLDALGAPRDLEWTGVGQTW